MAGVEFLKVWVIALMAGGALFCWLTVTRHTVRFVERRLRFGNAATFGVLLAMLAVWPITVFTIASMVEA